MSADILCPRCLAALTLVPVLDSNRMYIKEAGSRQQARVGCGLYPSQVKIQKSAPTDVKKKA